jgi:hypothetical protein
MDAYLMARVVFVALLYLAAAFGGLAAAQRLAGMPVPNLPAAALWMAFAGTVFYLLFLWIAVQAATQRAASVLANLIIFPLAMLGGCFFPFEWMPQVDGLVGKLTPNGWALSQFKSDPRQRRRCGAPGPATAAGGLRRARLRSHRAPRRSVFRRLRKYMLRDALYIARMDARLPAGRRETIVWTFVMPVVFFYFIGTITSRNILRPLAIPWRSASRRRRFSGRSTGAAADGGDYRVVRTHSPEEFLSYGRRLEIPPASPIPCSPAIP